MIINIVFSISNPFHYTEGKTLAEAGIAYYSQFPGYLGADHGSKALIMLLSIALPIGLFIYLKKLENFSLNNTIGLIAGCIGFALYGLSLMLQATTVEYAFNLYNSSEDAYTRQFATLLYEWSMLEGGLSVSIYIMANLLLATWLIVHSAGLNILGKTKKLSILGYITGILQILGYLLSWTFLMQGKQNMHDINELVGLLFVIWILIISIKMVRGKLIA